MGSAVNRRLQDELERKLDFADAVADAFVEAAQQHLERSDCESALRSAHVAASVLIRQNRRLTLPALERLLQAIASRLESADMASSPAAPSSRRGKPVCLHVMDEAMQAGGLTAMTTRWIDNDREHHVHCIALLNQPALVPDRVAEAVAASGGQIWLPPRGAGFVARALWLRALAATHADLIVLHVGVSDPIFAAALGRPGGAPILHVNHAAHVFWSGATIADRLANCRGSDMEGQWASRHRGARAVTIPIPLPAPEPQPTGPADGAQLRQAFGLPPDAQVLLTIGAAFKYQRTEQLDFLGAIEEVLRDVPGTHLLAVGVASDERWQAAARRVGGRIHALGPVTQAVIADARSITDVYVEGFPFGTTTSLLESGLRGIPAVLAPAESPPPYGSDGVALDKVLRRPASVAAYKQEVRRLLGDAAARRRLGDDLAHSIAAHHVGSGWAGYLSHAITALPAVHATAEVVEPEPTEPVVYRHWTRFIDQTESPYAESLEHAIVRAMLLGLRPKISATLRQACRRAGSFRDGHGIPAPLLHVALRYVLPLLPRRLAVALFRALAFFYRSAVLTRVVHRLAAALQGRKAGTWYDGYRNIR